MFGGTLVVSRAENFHKHFKKRFEELGFANVTVTALEGEGLKMLIDELKPGLVIMGARFHKTATPSMVADILQRFDGLNMAVVSISFDRYPADYGMSFIANHVNSFIDILDGLDQFYFGLARVREGKSFISPSVQERIDKRDVLPHEATPFTGKEMDVLRFAHNGLYGNEIAQELCVSLRTVNYYKRQMYNKVCVRNEGELVRVAEYMKLISPDDPICFGRNFELSPLPIEAKRGKRKSAENPHPC
jgi:DNA-binding NarL/FixJ family response regulator